VRDFGPLAMAQEELDEFLAGTPPQPCYATVCSLRRDGSPIGVPLGYLYEDGWIYFSMNPETSGTKRILRDPRVCVAVYNDHYPVKFAIITGLAEVYDDPGHQLEKRKFLRNMGHVGGEMDLEEYFRLHEQGGRVVFRVRVDAAEVASMDADKARDPRTGAMRGTEAVRTDEEG
jgi:nitroimidazol reductase NimA-like FMN-containing flavoprotein (pyridoxamine 5'-phosphate oxidase superfamily)